MIYPLCRRVVKNVDDSLAGHYARRSKLSRGGYSNDSYGMQDKKPKFVHPLSMRNITLSDSSEGFATADMVKEVGNISVTKEATVVVSPPRSSSENISDYSLASRAGTGYVVSCTA